MPVIRERRWLPFPGLSVAFSYAPVIPIASCCTIVPQPPGIPIEVSIQGLHGAPIQEVSVSPGNQQR
jgi:hypothetical protein